MRKNKTGLPLEGVGIPRFTREAWLKCFPGTSGKDYEDQQMPYGFMEYLAATVSGYTHVIREHPDIPIRTILIDGGYFDWLGGRPDSVQERGSYTQRCPCPEDEMAEKVDASGLNVNDLVYTVPLTGICTGKDTEAVLRQETVEALEAYFARMLDQNFSVYVPPYILKTGDCYQAFPAILSMADTWFRSGRRTSYGKYGMLSFPSGHTVTMLHVPVIIREVVPGGRLEAGDLLAYMGEETEGHPAKAGWYLNLVDFMLERENGRDDLDFAGFLAPERLSSSKAGKLLADDLGMVFADREMTELSMNGVIAARDIMEYHKSFLKDIRKEVRKAGRQLHIL